ncbi:cyclic nucleotide-binding domain-containing protein [Alicycliphilus denitrificans]|jgi:CRP-like cAMP-binding protein|uniref:Cyclic nucleotide-binding domain-containing protein n=2 Tax=Alicycliphilus denitrificans TaxID=179636 RepID=A0A3R7HUK1_9BURK|nr:cyclic nucleotide-binding domain-containing protein [Alicycliphilus denitrificans]OJW85356.1 MAG: Crp/Fnr family transcriptional regulator [Alicycliphilus sp. 69-12]GAO25698.1 Crp/Fnr family transcriptional regulator [Alicycliphilus sp. B1]ADV02100.1 cyclic nucleotide-binding protein [Alicycliphilus denitrificans BC]AEB87029.1 putative transcriptional regulator, Crp/Fnr family [Alicycliphilus denitrificans K601]MBN9574701.1 cyclic nucleotide-binding domain-containing protein [Alicycliphilus
MNTTPFPRVDLTGLIEAISQTTADDGMNNVLSREQWGLLSSYLQPVNLPAGQVLFAQGTNDRTLYLVESGSLSVHSENENQRLRLAIVGAGSVVGEGAFFSHRPRSATVQASAPSKLWSLTALRFSELANRQPVVALQLAMAVGAVLAKRLANRRRRVAAT